MTKNTGRITNDFSVNKLSLKMSFVKWLPFSALNVLMYLCIAEACVLLSLSNNRTALQWHHNECDGVSNHRCLVCLLNRLFWKRLGFAQYGILMGTLPIDRLHKSHNTPVPLWNICLVHCRICEIGLFTRHHKRNTSIIHWTSPILVPISHPFTRKLNK